MNTLLFVQCVLSGPLKITLQTADMVSWPIRRAPPTTKRPPQEYYRVSLETPSQPVPTPVRESPAWRLCKRAARALPTAACVAAGAAAYALGDWVAVAAGALIALIGAFALAGARSARSSPAAGTAGDAPAVSFAPDAAVERQIILQVVPVWKRNVEAARSHSERSMEGLLASFASVNAHLDEAVGGSTHSPVLEAGAIDRLVENHQPLLDELLAVTRRSVRLKDEMMEGLLSIADSLSDLVALSKEVQTISRATHLLALNASVEATRGGNGSGGFNVVAQEVRQLAAQSRQAGVNIGKRVAQMQERVAGLKLHVRREDTSDDEIALQAEESARAMISSVLRAVSDVTRSSRVIRSASRQVQSELENIFMGLQSQDRLSQMLTAVTDDMARFDSLAAGQPDPSAGSAREWLDRLEASYTMEELRSSHHGTVAIDKQAAVEFF